MKRLVFLFVLLSAAASLAAEAIPLDKWSLPDGVERDASAIKIGAGGQKHGALMWAPFRQTGEMKVWMLKVKLSGKGEIQGSLGCYSADKKRFLARHPFAEGTRKVNTQETIEEVWYLELPEKTKEPVG